MARKPQLKVANSSGQESDFSVRRLAEDIRGADASFEQAIDISRQLLGDARSEELEFITTDDIRHWLLERDPRVLSTPTRRSRFELASLLRRIPHDADVGWIVPLIEALNDGVLTADEAGQIPFPLQKDSDEKERDIDEERRDFIKRIADGITVPGGTPHPWPRSGDRFKKTPGNKKWKWDHFAKPRKPVALDVIWLSEPEKTRWFPPEEQEHSTRVTKCDQLFLIHAYISEKYDTCKQVKFQEMFDKSRKSAAENALGICNALKGQCVPVPSTGSVRWGCRNGYGHINTQIEFRCICA
ncbi:MAG: hypothetical protein QNJ44_06020 [Rhodobacter sp.]|nr:hypothetical protein [Rhodobacter sp.]